MKSQNKWYLILLLSSSCLSATGYSDDTWKCDHGVYTNVKTNDSCVPLQGGISIGATGKRVFTPSKRPFKERPPQEVAPLPSPDPRIQGRIFTTTDPKKLEGSSSSTSSSLSGIVDGASQAIKNGPIGLLEKSAESLNQVFKDGE